jgi:hypothetical protein
MLTFSVGSANKIGDTSLPQSCRQYREEIVAAQRARPADRQEEEQPMNRKKKTFVAIAMTAVLLSASSAAWAAMEEGDKSNQGGSVNPCSLDGVNPAHHPEIFGNPAVAASYGFVRSPNGTWQVRPGCRR